MPRYVCVHGHFYQPPRENPWLEFIELQESAAPWHDWNERIAAECYRRNGASRILDENGDIRKICNNYSRMSFNIGPTLLSWIKEKTPRTYRAILDADVAGAARFSGHGPALAQAYSHMILPLAQKRDKTTQVQWGIEDFKSHFGRMPEGMWLAETAVDTETLETLAENGIRFTLLAPKQASEVRPLAGETWRDVKGEKVDTSRPYRCDLPSGRSIAIFFYDGGLSQAIAFGGLLNDGGFFARRLTDACPLTDKPTLSHVATDGESYGHHHDHGDMALAYCLESLDAGQEATLTVYGEFLEKFPPEYAVRIVENSSWSCAHGVERWRSDCGCSGGTPGFHQRWRAPLREALDWLRDKLDTLYTYEAKALLKDPWGARNAYIRLILDRSRANLDAWMEAHASRPLKDDERTAVLKLMEMQRSAMLMYTSCGWFFDEISGIETTQILRYASRAIDLAHELTGLNHEAEFSRLLEKAPSNLPELLDGKRVYELMVKTARLSFERLAAHFGMVSLFPGYSRTGFVERCWEIEETTLASDLDSAAPNSRAFAVGKVGITSRLTREKREYLYAANHRGDTSIICGVLPHSEENAEKLLAEFPSLREVFALSDDRKIVEQFGHNIFSLRHILADAQRGLLDAMLQDDAIRIENSLKAIVSDYSKLFQHLALIEAKAPPVIASAASIVVSSDIFHALEADTPDTEGIRQALNKARQWGLKLDEEKIRIGLNRWLQLHMQKIHDTPDNPAMMERTGDILALFMDDFKWHLSLYEAQNLYYATQNRHRAALAQTPAVRAAFRKLGTKLKFSPQALE